MKRALTAPTLQHLARLYYELGKKGARAVGRKNPWPYQPSGIESLFALGADLSRFDPRLLELLVQWSLSQWKNFKPQQLRQEMKKMETPQTLGVIGAFAKTEKPEDKEMNLFWKYVLEELPPVEPQFYFRDLYLPESTLAQKAVRESLSEFRRWGFFGRQRVMVDPITKKTIGTWEQPERLNLLKRLFAQKKQIQISDYLEAVESSISRQQALLDLKALKAKPYGAGRSAGWRKTKIRV